jgi:endonuclease/exonuclease/phosphatase family metal-dependent hydrolase
LKKKSIYRTSWVGRLILLLNLLFVALLISSYLSIHIAPDKFWPLAFAGLAYPVFLLINLGFVLLWIIRKNLFFLLSLVVIIAGFDHFSNTLSLKPVSQLHEFHYPSLKVLSYNVRVFDIYSYRPGWIPDFTNRNNIFSFLEKNDFDIICFQEFVHDNSGNFKTLDTLPDFLRAGYSHFEYARNSRNINFFGVATFSAYPIVNRGRLNLTSRGGNMGIYTDIKIEQDTIRIYNVHLESIGLSPEDYVFIDGIFKGDNGKISQDGKRIMRRIKSASIARAQQARDLAAHISQSPYPVILTGDFNDTPVSYVYNKLRNQLHDAFHSGFGLGKTYTGIFPTFRIDYILHSDHFTSSGFTTGNQEYSDHFPIYTTLQITSGAKKAIHP